MAEILAVDDSRAILSLITHILQNAGHTVHAYPSGTEALEFARSQAVDLVLSDVNMPGMTGISLVSKLRRLPNYETTPVLMITTETADYKKQKSKSMGANGWVQKPFTEETLLAATDKMLTKS